MPAPVKRTLALLCASLSGVGLAACGNTVSAAFKGEEHEVAQAISNLQTDATAGNEQKLCANDLASAVVTQLNAKGGCKQAIKNRLTDIDIFEVSVQSVQVKASGGRRTASASVRSIYSGKTRASTLSLVKEGGKWKILSVQ
jgi:hypothetical protein